MKGDKIKNTLLDLLSTSLIALLILSTLEANITRADSGSDTASQSNIPTIQNRSNTTGWGVNSNYPVVSNSEVDRLPCYMQTADGRTLDLWRLCAGGLIKQLLATGKCVKCNLSGVNLANLDLSNLDLSGANLSGANLTGTNLSGTNLSNTIMPDGQIHN